MTMCQGVRLAAQGGGAVAARVAGGPGRSDRAAGGTGADEPVDLGPADEVRVLTTGAEIVVALRSDQAVTGSGAPAWMTSPRSRSTCRPWVGSRGVGRSARGRPDQRAALFVLYGRR